MVADGNSLAASKISEAKLPHLGATRDRHPRVTIVIPAKNEAKNLEIVLPRLPDVHEIVLVDGHSVDGTVDVARRMRPGIKVVKQTRRGKGNALVCGFEVATGDIIVMFDADGSADPDEIPVFVAALVAGADFAKGSRFCGEGGGSADITRFRRVGNYCLNTLANVLIRTRYTDLCYGFNAFWSDVLTHLDLPSSRLSAITPDSMIWGDGFEVETVINCRIAAANLTVTEVPSFEKARIHGKSNLRSVSDGWRVLKTIGTERRRLRSMVESRSQAGSAGGLSAASGGRPMDRGVGRGQETSDAYVDEIA